MMRGGARCRAMEGTRRAELERAYHETTYAAAVDVRLKIGQRNRLVDALCEDRGVETWAFLTAYNPDARERSDDENRAAQQALLDELRERGLAWFVGAGEADDGSYPPEPALLVLGLSRDDAIALGRRLRQVAIVVGQRGAAPELVWL